VGLLLRADADAAEAAPLPAASAANFSAAGCSAPPPPPLPSLAAAASSTERIISLPPSSPTRFSLTFGCFPAEAEEESAATRERSSECACPRPETAAVFSPRALALAASLRCEMISGVMTLGGLERSTGLLRVPVVALEEAGA
jgi:hypothetical protein